MKIQTKWFAMFAAAGIGALLLMSLFAGSALAQASATPTPMIMQPLNPSLRRGLPVITSTMPMTAMQQMPAAMPGSPMSHTMPMSMTMPTASGGMCQDDKCSMMPDMMQMMQAMMAGSAMTSTMPTSMTYSGAMIMQPDMMAKMQNMMEMMHAMMSGGMMSSTMPMSMTQSGGMMMPPDMMGLDMSGKMQAMMKMMHAMMAGGMMSSSMPMSMTHSGGMMMQPGQMRQGMMQQPDMMQPDMMAPDMARKMQGRGAGPGRIMRPGMIGPDMRDDPWAMPWMPFGAAQDQRLTGDQAVKAATNALATRNNPDLQIAEVLEFEDAFYVRVAEQSTGINAFELLIHPYTGMTRQEAGPSMIWNTKYGGSEGMAAIMRQGWAAPGAGQPTADMLIKPDQALKNAQAYLDAQKNAQKVMQAAKYYGYYVVPTLGSDGRVAGLLAVNGYTGRVWDENRFGKLLGAVTTKK